ncbi:MAG: 2Fe-2S iron-sulfur cluster binding domain-containing protein, partial [Clostridia bacterium]|nr:2Fe-2S iron-sulfur cluster binding domain-containing protein [Clostridia bacterium]
MPTLTVKNGDKEIKLAFSGTPILRDVLAENGFAVISPCGGKGVCGKCAVIVCGDITPPDERESDLNLRLSCRTRLLGDAFVELKRSEYIFDK